MALRPITDEEREFVRAAFPQLGVTEIARKLGRSRTAVNEIVRRERLRETVRDEGGGEPPGGGAVVRLEELRDALREAMLKAPTAQIAGIAREYRATIEAIERMEGGDGDGSSAAIEAIARSISQKMSA